MAKKTLEQRRKEAEQQLRRNAATFAEGVEATRQAQQGSASNASMTAEKEREILAQRAAESSARRQTADTSQQEAARTQALDLRANRYRAGAMSAYGSVFGTPERSRDRSDEELAKAAKDFLDSGDTSNQKGFLKQYSATEQAKLRRYLNQYQQEAAQSAEEQQQRASYLRGLDVASAQSELDDLNKRLDNAARAKKAVGDNLSQVNRVMPGSSLWQQLNEDVDALQPQRDQLQRDVSEASRLQTSDRYAALKGNSDFSEGVRRGEELTHNDSLQTWMGRGSSTGYMTEDEWDTFNYLRGTQGDAASQEYLDFLREELNRREGQYEAEQVRDTGNYGPFGKVGRGVVTGLYGVAAGLDQAASGARQTAENIFGEGDKLPTSSLQYGSSYIGQDLEDTGAKIGSFNLSKAGYDVINTTANMLPSILASYATGGIAGGLGAGTKAASLLSRAAGGAAMATSVYGNAYNQALQDGYTKEQANAYGLLSAASETGLQYALGGITALGGTVTNSVGQKLVANISSPAVQALARVGINSLGEGSEEYLQEIIDPLFRNLVFQEGNQFKAYTPEAAYAFLLGALSAGLIEAPTQLRTPETIASAGRGVMESGHTDDLLQRALAMPGKSVSHRRAAAMQNSTPDEQSVGYLLDAYQQDGGDLSFLTQPPTPTPDNTETVTSAVETLPMSDQAAQPQRPQTLPMVDRAGQIVQQRAAQTVQGAILPTAQPANQARQVTTLPMREEASSGLYTTSIDTDPSAHTPEENARIQEYTRSTDSKIVSFINRVLGLKNRNFRNKVNLEFAPVSDRAAADILSMTGVDASGFTHELTGRAVDHIIDRHGPEGEADTSMRDFNDIARIGYVLEHYDYLEPIRNSDGSPKTTQSYRMADNSQAPMVKFVKKIDGTYYAVEAVTDSKAHRLGVISAYMNDQKNGSDGQVFNMGQTAPRNLTPSAMLDRPASIDSVPQSSTPVNPDTAQQEASPDTQQGDTIGIQFFAEPGSMTEGDFPIDTARLNRMVERATAEVNQALSQRTMTRADVEQTVSAMLSKEFGLTKANADSLATRFGAQYQAIIDQGIARLSREMDEGDGVRQPTQANNTWQNATQMTPEEREIAGMEPGGEAYTTRSEAYSNDQARSLIDRLGWDGAYQYLMRNDTWNPADVKAAVEVGRHLLSQARTETDQKAKESLYEQAGQIGMRYQQDRSAAGRSLQASAEYASDPVLEAVGQLEKLLKESKVGQKMSEEERAAAIADAAKRGQELQDVLSAESNVSDLVSYIERYARDRGITRTVVRGKTREVSGIIHNILAGSSQEDLYRFAQASLEGYLADKYSDPSNLGQRLKTLQVLSHLFNPRTWMRNVVGNTTFSTVDSAANRFAATLDILVGKRTGTRSTAAGPNFFSREAMSAKRRALAQSVAAVYLDLDLTHEANRYGQVSQRTFRMNSDSKVAALTRALSKLERNLSYALTSTDQFAKGGVQATQQARIQQMLDAGQIDPERLGVDVTPEEYAGWRGKELAKYRTFQDNSRLAAGARSIHDTLNLAGVGDSGRTINGKTVKAFGLGDLLMPYPGVPGNIASRALEYSPVGLAKGIVDLSKVLKSGKNATVQNQSQAVLELSRGITGAALIGLAAFAAANGIIRSTDDDDNLDEKRLNSAEGINGIQVNLSALLRGMSGESTQWQQGDRLAALDYLQPVNAWLALGCFVDSYLSGDKDYDAFTASVDAFGNSIEDFPVLQTLQSIVDDVRYNDMGVASAVLQESAGSIMSSLVPALVRGIATAADPYQRDTTSGEYGAVSLYDWISQSTGMKLEFLKALAEFFDNTLKVDQSVSTIMNSVPGLRQMLPIKLDNYGQPMGYTGSRPLDVANALLLPGSVYSYNQRELTKALAEISAYTGTATFYPSRNPVKSVEYGGTNHEMTFEQRQEYQKTYGTVYYDMANELIQTQVWQDADPMTRADMLSQIKSIASAQARVHFMDTIGQDYTGSESARLIAKLDEMAAGGVDFATYYDWKNRLSAFSGDEKQADILSALASSGLSETQQRTLYYGVGGYSISEEKLAQGREVGLDEEDLKKWRYRFDQASKVDGWSAQQISDNLIQPSAELSADQKHVLGDMFLTEYIPIEQAWDVDYSSPEAYILSQLPDSAQDRYEAIVQDYLTPQQWSDIYNRYSGYKRKDQKIAAMMADGYSESEANTLYGWMSKDIDDSYYVGKMSDAALYYWQNGLGAEDIMSPKQWLTLTEEYAGVDYQTALDAMRKAGYTEYYASIFANWLSHM